MPNKSILEREKVTIGEIVEKYKEMESLEKVATYFSVSEKTVRKYLTQAGVVRHQGPRKAHSKEVPQWHHGCLAQWIKANPQRALPRRYSAIQELTGCTLEEIRTYLYRRRRYVREKMKKYPNLSVFRMFLTDNDGTRYPTVAFESGHWSYNRRSFLVTYVAVLRGTEKTIRITHTVEDWDIILGFRSGSG